MSFSTLHPALLVFYFISVLLPAMFSGNPIVLMTAFIGAMLYYLKSQKSVSFLRDFGFVIFLFVLVTLTNPLFSHKGATALFFMNLNPVTLEALIYGAVLGLMLCCTVFWFKCLNIALTEDKLLFLTGKVSPKLGLLISSALRFIPLLKAQSEKIRLSQKALGLYQTDSIPDKVRSTLRVYSALVSWGLENAIDSGASMKARGYGLKGRSSFSLYRFSVRDGVLTAVILILDALFIYAGIMTELDFKFYPYIQAPQLSLLSMTAYLSYGVLAMMPFILEVKEDLMWKYCKSKI